MNEEEGARRLLEIGLLDRQLGKAEAVAREMLTMLDCPIDPVAVEELLREGRHTLNVAERRQVRDAMQILLLLSQVRRHVTLGYENAARAAHDAFLAGVLASDGTRHALKRQTMRVVGVASGAARAREARQLRRDVAAYRQRNPDHSATAIARALVQQHGDSGTNELDNLARRIRRLLAKK